MTAEGDRRLAFMFGLIAAALLIVDAIVRFFIGILFLATGRGFEGLGSVGSSLVIVVFGILIGFFAILGRSRQSDSSLAAGRSWSC